MALRALADEPRPPGCRKLASSANSFRLRVGEYRILYEVDDSVGLEVPSKGVEIRKGGE